MADLWADISRQLVQGADIILGAFIGSGVAYLAAYFADRRRFKREDEAVRREVYAEFTLRWTLHDEAKKAFKQLEPESPQKLDEAYRQLLRTFNALSFVAPEEVREAADELVKWSERDDEDRDPDVPGRYWEVARKDVGISD
ncbi:MAG TPA: hypothetical protein VFH16_18910 [Rubrobacter sp.]|nr:hypothetical protein [Rubrobacter sp.]